MHTTDVEVKFVEGAIFDSMFSKGLETFVVNYVPIRKAPGEYALDNFIA